MILFVVRINSSNELSHNSYCKSWAFSTKNLYGVLFLLVREIRVSLRDWRDKFLSGGKKLDVPFTDFAEKSNCGMEKLFYGI